MSIELSKPSESEVIASNPECAIAPSGIRIVKLSCTPEVSDISIDVEPI